MVLSFEVLAWQSPHLSLSLSQDKGPGQKVHTNQMGFPTLAIGRLFLFHSIEFAKFDTGEDSQTKKKSGASGVFLEGPNVETRLAFPMKKAAWGKLLSLLCNYHVSKKSRKTPGRTKTSPREKGMVPCIN
jgi:hypothetical protein